jgi:V8-like Glu-specific endopeptidase
VRNSCSRMLLVSCVGLLSVRLLGGPFYVFASEGPVIEVSPESIDAYWTPERLKNAKSLPLPRADTPSTTETGAPETMLSNPGVPEGYDGQPPTVPVHPDGQNRLFVPEPHSQAGVQGEEGMPVTPYNVGTAGALFSSSRLIPLNADRRFPYKTAGRLFFSLPGGTAACSAAVISFRLILTAGHCVHSGNGDQSGFFSNWLFVPAYRDGVAPFGKWPASAVITTADWAYGGGIVPNPADYALLELKDQTINGQRHRIGGVTGFLGFQTLSLFPNHVHMLGYPSQLDAGKKIHQVTAQSFLQDLMNNVVFYGTDMAEGSSGGPWIQNFGVNAVGAPVGLNPGRNRVVGVTSFGLIGNPDLKAASSILDARFTDIRTTICNHKAGNCS